MDCHELSLKMGRQLRQCDTMLRQSALYVVTIGVAVCSLLQIEQTNIPARDLDALVIEFGGPCGYGIERVERRLVAGELRQKDRWSFDCLHELYYLLCGQDTATSGIWHSVHYTMLLVTPVDIETVLRCSLSGLKRT